MFQSARIKLTAWYLLIIMCISIFFSVAFYNVSTQEIHRVIQRIQLRQQRLNNDFFPFIVPFDDPNLHELQESEDRLKVILIIINGCILFLSGVAGYFLAGRTLRPIREMVEEQNRFVTDASHELRTPLTALRSELEASLLEKHITEKEAKALLSSNLEEVVKLQALSDNLLQLTQYQNQKTPRLFEDISLLQVIEDALRKVTPLAKQKHIAVNNEIDDVLLKGNAHDLTELFVILLDNAVKYSPGKTTITLSAKKREAAVSIVVADEGIGIDKKDLPYIFDRFYRADPSRTKSQTTGYGLGLAIARKIVEEHNGDISVKSISGKGTSFMVRLPLRRIAKS